MPIATQNLIAINWNPMTSSSQSLTEAVSQLYYQMLTLNDIENAYVKHWNPDSDKENIYI